MYVIVNANTSYVFDFELNRHKHRYYCCRIYIVFVHEIFYFFF